MAKPLSSFENSSSSRNETIVKAYASGGYKMSELAVYFGLHYSAVSKVIRDYDVVIQDLTLVFLPPSLAVVHARHKHIYQTMLKDEEESRTTRG